MGLEISKFADRLGICVIAACCIVPLARAEEPESTSDDSSGHQEATVNQNAHRMIHEGRRTFRFDTFGDEAFWGDTLKLHQAIEGERFGGVGPGVSPHTALAVGLKVDVDALPRSLIRQLRRGEVDLDDVAVTLALLRLNAIVGVTGIFDGDDSLRTVGIQCALCHSTVDNSLLPGFGKRLDGWASRDLNVGAIIALAPDLSVLANLLGVDEDTVRTVLRSWGPGKFDAELILDGKAFRPNDSSGATLIPPAFGLPGVNLHTWTGWGSVTHWNAFVANLEMHGQGTFYDPRLDNAEQFPIAAREGFGHIRNTPDLITSKRCTFTNSQSQRRDRLETALIIERPDEARSYSTTPHGAQRATCHRCSRSPDGISIRPKKLVSTISRLFAHRTCATEPHR
jgi:hypothetical protein